MCLLSVCVYASFSYDEGIDVSYRDAYENEIIQVETTQRKCYNFYCCLLLSGHRIAVIGSDGGGFSCEMSSEH